MQALRPSPKQQITQEAKQEIIRAVNDGIVSWNDSKSIGIRQHFIDLVLQHKVVALMMDALYKHHFQGKLNEDILPSTLELNTLYHETLDVLLTNSFSRHDMFELELLKNGAFKPRIKETLETLRDKFNEVPYLRDIAHEHRWRLLADHVMVEMLEKHGLNGCNPLLAFIFDVPASEADELAEDWVTAMSSVDLPFTEERIAAIASGADFYTNVMKFGVLCSPGQKLRIADFMHTVATRFGIATVLENENCSYLQTPEKARKYTKANSGEAGSDNARLTDSASSVRELMERETGGKNVTQLFSFQRGPIPGEMQKKKQNLKDVVSHFLAPVEDLLNKLENESTAQNLAPEEVLFTASQTYFNQFMLHARANKNYRSWGLLVPNILFAKAGQGIALSRDLSRSSGPTRSSSGPDNEIATTFEEGHRYCRLLRSDVRNMIHSDPSAYFSPLRRQVLEGRLTDIEEMVIAARLYPEHSPTASEVQGLLNTAIQTGQSSQIKSVLTDFPRFDIHAKSPDNRSWLSIAAGAGDWTFCMHLLRMGADPDEVKRGPALAAHINQLLDAASALHKLSAKIKVSHKDGWDKVFKALKSYDVETLREELGGLTPPLGQDNALHHFMDSLATDQPNKAFAILALAKTELHRQADSLTPGELKEILDSKRVAGKPLLCALASPPPAHTSGISAFLAWLQEMPVSHRTMLEILTERDDTGAWALHHAINSDNAEAVSAILDFIRQLDVPPEDKLAAILIKDDQGNSSLDWVADPRIAKAIFQSIAELSPIPGKLEAVSLTNEHNESLLDRLVQAENAEIIRPLLEFVAELDEHEAPDRSKADFALAEDMHGRTTLTPMNTLEMAETAVAFLSPLDIPTWEKAEAFVIGGPEDGSTALGADLSEGNIQMARLRINAVLALQSALSTDEKNSLKEIFLPLRENQLIREMLERLETAGDKRGRPGSSSSGSGDNSQPPLKQQPVRSSSRLAAKRARLSQEQSRR
jgi:hypothetical protein